MQIKIICLLISFFASSAFAANPDCRARTDFDNIIKVITEKFYDKNFKGIDWQARVKSYRQNVLCSFDDDKVATTVNDLLKELNTSHTALYTPRDLKYWGLNSIFSGGLFQYKISFSGIWPVQIGQQTFVKFVLDDSAAAIAGVKTGDELLAIGNVRFSSLGFRKGESSELEFASTSEKKKRVKIRPATLSLQSHFLEATKKSKAILRVENKKIGYLHLWCGTHEAFLQTLNSTLKEFETSAIAGLIIDLRDGFGGASPEYLNEISENPFYKKIPLVFLINEGVTSGKEWLAAIVKAKKIGTLVGIKTAGAFMAGAAFNLLSDRYLLYLAVREFNPPDIPRIEGIGVEPDIEVPACARFCKGKDPQFDKALETILFK